MPLTHEPTARATSGTSLERQRATRTQAQPQILSNGSRNREKQIASRERLDLALDDAASRELPFLVFRVVVRCRSEEQTSELQSLMRIPYAVFCLTKTQTSHNTVTVQSKTLFM